MPKWIRGMIAVLALAALALWLPIGDTGSAPVAADTGFGFDEAGNAACPGAPQGARRNFTPPAHAMGTITAINGAVLTVKGKNNTTSTVTTDGNTHFDVVVNSTFGAIAVGDFIMVKGTSSGTGTFAATAIMDNGKPMRPAGATNRPAPPAGAHPMPPPGCKPPERPANGNPGNRGGFAIGVVQQINGTSLVIGFPKGGKTTTVTTTGSTTVTTHKQGTIADLHLNDEVIAAAAPKGGTASNAPAFTAAFVRDQTAH